MSDPTPITTTTQVRMALRSTGATNAIIDVCVSLVKSGRATFEQEGNDCRLRFVDDGMLFAIGPGGLRRIQ